MALPIYQTPGTEATAINGKPINVGDSVSIQGTVTAVTNAGPTATIAVTLARSLASINVQANDCGASTQTL